MITPDSKLDHLVRWWYTILAIALLVLCAPRVISVVAIERLACIRNQGRKPSPDMEVAAFLVGWPLTLMWIYLIVRWILR